MGKLVRKEYITETKATKDRTMTVRISTSSPDRSKDVVVPSGAMLDNYMRNPVVALSHKYDELAIAKTESINITDDGIIATLRFPDKGVYSVADTVYELYKEGFMNAWSIGFIPTEVTDLEGGGRQFDQWELLEYSAVLVPDNPQALTLIRSKSIDTKEFEDVVSGKLEVKDKVVDLKALFTKDEPVAEPPKEETPEEKPAESVVEDKPAEPIIEDKPAEPVQPVEPEKPAEPISSPEPEAPVVPAEGNPIVEKVDEKIPAVSEGESVATGEVEEKSKHLIGGKSKKMVLGIIDQMQQLQLSLQGLLEATLPDAEDEAKEQNNIVIGLVDALKMADKTVGLALRDYKAKAELGKVPDDSLVSEKGESRGENL